MSEIIMEKLVITTRCINKNLLFEKIMKQPILILILLSMSILCQGQSIKLGFQASPQLSWMKSTNIDITNQQSRLGIKYGLEADLFLLKVPRYSLNTGLCPESFAECDSRRISTISRLSLSANVSISLTCESMDRTCFSSDSVLLRAYSTYLIFSMGITWGNPIRLVVSWFSMPPLMTEPQVVHSYAELEKRSILVDSFTDHLISDMVLD